MREVLTDWRRAWIPAYHPRRINTELLEGVVPKVYLFTGCRRAGKTFLMYQLIDYLHRDKGVDREDIIYINFEDERVVKQTATLTELLPLLVELYGERDYHLFLDEIHTIPDWDLWVRRVYDQQRNIRLYLASSSSKLSTHEVPYALRGRAMALEVYPLGFPEYCRFKGLTFQELKLQSSNERARLKAALTEYLDFGGFPAVVLEESRLIKQQTLQDYFNTIVDQDIVERYQVTNRSALQEYIRLLLGQTLYSTNKMFKFLKSNQIEVGKETLLNFTRYLEEVYLVFFVPILSAKAKDALYYPRKVYFIDNGFPNHLTTRFTDNLGRRLENQVFLELLKRWGRYAIRYWRGSNGYEVDFAVVDGAEVPLIAQVCHDPSDPDTLKRELRALTAAGKELEPQRLVMVTWDSEGEEQLGNGAKVELIPLYRWLQEQEAQRQATVG